jgi:organic radical activating enzyme
MEFESSTSTQPGIRTMDLRVGNICNLACRMCSPFSSVALLEEWSDTEHPTSKVMEESIGAYRQINWQNWSELPEVWDDLFEISEHVDEINFAGGEPFLNVAHVNYLKRLIQSGRSRDIRISYNTNLTVIPQWLEPIIESFRTVKIMVSVDGVGALGEFIRHPLKWNSFEQNLVKLDRLKGAFRDNVEIAFNTTVQVYNIFGLTELLDYLANSSLTNLPRSSSANLLENPSYFNVANLPAEIKKAARRKIESYLSKTENQQHTDFLTAVKRQLEVDTPDEVENNSTKEFRSVTAFYDKKRRQSFATLVPEMGSLLQR